MKVEKLMAKKVETLDRNDTLSLAEDLMKMKRLRHLPVLDEERLVGIVTQRDLLHAGLSIAMGFGTKTRDAFLKTVLVEHVDVSPRRVRFATGIACSATNADVLLIGHTNYDIVTRHSRHLVASFLEIRRRDVLQNLRAEYRVEMVVRKSEAGNVTGNGRHTALRNLRPFQIESCHEIEGGC